MSGNYTTIYGIITLAIDNSKYYFRNKKEARKWDLLIQIKMG